MKLMKWITSLFTTPSYQESVDRFINSKHPKNVAEVDYWVNYFMQHKLGA